MKRRTHQLLNEVTAAEAATAGIKVVRDSETLFILTKNTEI